MSVSHSYTCNVCGKKIANTGYDMVTITATAIDYKFDDGSVDVHLEFHVHKSGSCWGKILQLLK